MVMSNTKSDNTNFIAILRQRAQNKADEYHLLLQEKRRIDLLLEKTKANIELLNRLLEHEGQSPVTVKIMPAGSSVGRPGNRASDFPVRKPEWEAMGLDQIIKIILERAPESVYHVNTIAEMIYEIQSPVDLKRVKHTLVSTLRRGAKQKELWGAIKGNRYKAKIPTTQERLISA